MLKPGGLFFLGVPMSCAYAGALEFNAQRIYGFDRLAYVAAGFDVVGFVPPRCVPSNIVQGVLLRKPASGHFGAASAADFALVAGG